MMTLLKKENLKNTILTLFYLVVGVLLCVIPVKMFNFIETALCGILLIVGVVSIVIYALLSADDKPLKLLIYGIVGMGLGVFMMLVPRVFGITLSVIIGYGGVSMIISALKQKKKAEKTWITEFVIGIIVTALAVATIVLSSTNVAKKFLSIFFGIMLLINGIYNLIIMIMVVVKENKEKKKTLVLSASEGPETTEVVEEIKEEVTEETEESKTKKSKEIKE